MRAIIDSDEIQVFNHGKMERDFTFIDDIAEGIRRVMNFSCPDAVPARIYNIGNSRPVSLLDFIHIIEDVTGCKARMRLVDMQPGDVVRTCADIRRLQNDFGYKPATTIQQGISQLYAWMKSHADTAIMTKATTR